ncbi:MAG: Beta-barrel assembly-enhancing protease [Candidatus Ordinivivax streblomastigis]|uniref:Beta-barrel assembly-enhancing protease n=1 Tax=Candidatus Ordinivivax streblomastigis TaxID=2540710 RepID=A0A5M8P085_9BACT|nr:MAG: Beta-barrel assembly-enhancing protease [Candidatus Ordinivivax streblomastigis]
MKKSVFLFAICLFAGLTFAQKKAVNLAKTEVKSLTPNIGDAREAIKGALTNPETADKAETWFVAGRVEDKSFGLEQAKEIIGQKANDDVMYPSLDQIYPYFAVADSLDQLPNEKGKVKLKYRDDIQAILAANRPYYTNAGSYFYNKGNYQKAYENFKFYGDIPKLSIFEGDTKHKFEVLAEDSNAVRFRYYAALAALQIPNQDAALEIYLEIKDMGFSENEIYQRIAEIYKEKTDTVHYVAILQQGTSKFPAEAYYILNLINITINQGNTIEAIDYLNKAIEVSTDNQAQLYDVLGIVYENLGELDNAINNVKKALEIDPDYTDALSHLGRIYYNIGIEERNEVNAINDKKQYEQAKVKYEKYFKDAIPYFEKAYQANSEDKDAVIALRNIYYALGKNAEYEKWDKIYSGE